MKPLFMTSLWLWLSIILSIVCENYGVKGLKLEEENTLKGTSTKNLRHSIINKNTMNDRELDSFPIIASIVLDDADRKDKKLSQIQNELKNTLWKFKDNNTIIFMIHNQQELDQVSSRLSVHNLSVTTSNKTQNDKTSDLNDSSSKRSLQFFGGGGGGFADLIGNANDVINNAGGGNNNASDIIGGVSDIINNNNQNNETTDDTNAGNGGDPTDDADAQDDTSEVDCPVFCATFPNRPACANCPPSTDDTTPGNETDVSNPSNETLPTCQPICETTAGSFLPQCQNCILPSELNETNTNTTDPDDDETEECPDFCNVPGGNLLPQCQNCDDSGDTNSTDPSDDAPDDDEEEDEYFFPSISQRYYCYRNTKETKRRMRELEINNENLVKTAVLGPTYLKEQKLPGGDLIRSLKVSNFESTADKSHLVIVCGLNPKELAGPEVCLRFAEYMISSYKKNPDESWILDYTVLHFIINANPDGRKNEEENLYFRNKNMHFNSSAPSICGVDDNGSKQGVNLNRNFPHSTWGTSSVTGPCGDDYPGTDPGSEPETKAIMDYILKTLRRTSYDFSTTNIGLTQSGMLIDIHANGRSIKWPNIVDNYNVIPNEFDFKILANKMAMETNPRYNTNNNHGDGGNSRGPSGTLIEWTYEATGAPAYAVQLGTDFHQECNHFPTVYENARDVLLYAARVARRPFNYPQGPDLIDLQLEQTSIPQCDVLNVTVVVSDASRQTHENSSPFDRRRLDVTAIRLYVDGHPYNPGQSASVAYRDIHSWGPEGVQFGVDTCSLTLGRHAIAFQADDSFGGQGPVYAKFFEVTCQELDDEVTLLEQLNPFSNGFEFTANGFSQGIGDGFQQDDEGGGGLLDGILGGGNNDDEEGGGGIFDGIFGGGNNDDEGGDTNGDNGGDGGGGIFGGGGGGGGIFGGGNNDGEGGDTNGDNGGDGGGGIFDGLLGGGGNDEGGDTNGDNGGDGEEEGGGIGSIIDNLGGGNDEGGNGEGDGEGDGGGGLFGGLLGGNNNNNVANADSNGGSGGTDFENAINGLSGLFGSRNNNDDNVTPFLLAYDEEGENDDSISTSGVSEVINLLEQENNEDSIIVTASEIGDISGILSDFEEEHDHSDRDRVPIIGTTTTIVTPQMASSLARAPSITPPRDMPGHHDIIMGSTTSKVSSHRVRSIPDPNDRDNNNNNVNTDDVDSNKEGHRRTKTTRVMVQPLKQKRDSLNRRLITNVLKAHNRLGLIPQ